MYKFSFCLTALLLATAMQLYAQDKLMPKSQRSLDSIYQHKSKSVDSLKKNISHRTDTLKKINHSADSIYQHSYKSLDSLQKKFHAHTDSLQKVYAAPLKKLDAGIARLKHKKDSLSKLNLPTTSLTHKIDSLQGAQTARMNELNTKIEKAKKETLDKVSSLHLPPQAQSEINALTKNINGLKVPNNFFQAPNMNLAGLSSNLKIPSLNLPSNISIPPMNIPSLQKVSLNSLKIPSLAQMKGPLDSEIKKLQSLKSADAKALEQEAMNVASQNKEAKSLLQEQSKVKDMEKQLSGIKNPKRVDSLAMQQLQPAVNHFMGKEKELTAAMDKVSKLKQKYSSVTSLADLPKRAPNPLKGKPWIERIVPGLNYFIQNKHYTLVDFNPYIGWRFNPRLTVALGWNQRIGISHYAFSTHTYDHVYGVRGSVSYLWTHGINFKVSPEVMSAYIPTNGILDVRHEAHVFGVYAGIRKDFPIYKSVKGYSEVMYNFTQKTFQNIYGDPVSFRFGMEVKLKKKAKKNGVGMVNPSSLNKVIHPTDSFHIVRKEKLFGVVGIKGDTIVSVKYQSIKKFLSDGKLYFIVKKDNKFGALSSDGKDSVPVSHLVPATVKLEIIDRVKGKYNLDKLMK